jgi:hypothetical protein
MVVASPILEFLVLFVRGISESILQVVKSAGAAPIFRGTGTLAARADRICRAWGNRQTVLQHDSTLPNCRPYRTYRWPWRRACPERWRDGPCAHFRQGSIPMSRSTGLGLLL